MKKILFLSSMSFMVFAMVVLTILGSGIPAKPEDKLHKFTNSKVIVSHLGEVQRDMRYVGEIIRYKIYYFNELKQKANMSISDSLDPSLTDISVFNNGKYDQPSHSVYWQLKDVPAGKGGFVQFEATLSKAEIVRNKAAIKIGEQHKKIETNTVETTVHGKPKVGWIPFIKDTKPGDTPRSYMKEETTMGAMVNFDVPGVFIHEVKVKDVVYHRLSIPGRATLTNVGKPELPIVGQIIEVPYGVKINTAIVKAKSIILKYYNVFPAQEPQPDRHGIENPFFIEKATYLTNALYPEELSPITAEDIGVIRGRRVVFLKVNPIQYNPVAREIKVFSQIEVRFNYDRPGQIRGVDRRIESEAFEELLKASVLNYKHPDRFDRPDAPKEKDGCDYLIITHSDFYNMEKVNDPNDPSSPSNPNNPIVQLRNWKRLKGYIAKVVEVDDIPNGTTASDIRDYIKDVVYKEWYPVPTYILLVGDAGDNAGNEIIPTHYIDTDGNPTTHPFGNYNGAETGTDLYYVTVDGSDYFPDIFIGRLPVDTLTQAEDVIDKIIDYEQNPPATPANAAFYTDVSLIALFEDIFIGPGDPTPEDGREDRPWIENVEEIRDYLDTNYNPDSPPNLIYATSSGFPPATLNDPAPQQYQNGTALPPDLQVPGFGWNGSGADITAAINAGRFLVTYRDHGSRNAWSQFFGFDNTDVDALVNGNLTPVVFSIACENGWFDNETDDDATLGAWATADNAESFCEHFLRNTNGGAVAIIGATRVSWTGWNDFFMFGLHKSIWQDFDPNPPITGYPAIPEVETGPLVRMGQILTYGQVFMANAYNDSDIRKLQFEMYHLFGDPEMPIWTEAPLTLKVDYPKDIGSTGTQDFIVKVTDNASGDPVHMAVVTLTREDSILRARLTNPDGIARFTFTPASGDLDITVTAHNYRPHQDKIGVSSNGAWLNRLDPDNGVADLTSFYVGGMNFSGNEDVKIYFGDQYEKTKAATAGSFGQASVEDVDIRVPSPYSLGPVNITAHGQTSDRYAVDVFYVRTANPIDLYTYSQWDSTTWHLHAGGNPTWNNPEIQLYDSSNNPVESNDLIAGNTYTIKAKIHNDTSFDAQGVKVTFTAANFGAGQTAWTYIDTDTLNIPGNSVREATTNYAPLSGHRCILVEIHHVEDMNVNNNEGQENCTVRATASPAKIPFLIWNPTKKTAAVHLELRQLIKSYEQEEERIWKSRIRQPDPQAIPAGEKQGRKAMVSIDPPADVQKGQKAEFTLTAYIGKKMIGGVNFIIIKK